MRRYLHRMQQCRLRLEPLRRDASRLPRALRLSARRNAGLCPLPQTHQPRQGAQQCPCAGMPRIVYHTLRLALFCPRSHPWSWYRRRSPRWTRVGLVCETQHRSKAPRCLIKRLLCVSCWRKARMPAQRADQPRPGVPKLAALMGTAETDVLAFMTSGNFPNEAPVSRLVGVILLEQNDECAVQRRYMTLRHSHPSAMLRTSACPPRQAQRETTRLDADVFLHYGLKRDLAQALRRPRGARVDQGAVSSGDVRVPDQSGA
jgi:hypothetical protein